MTNENCDHPAHFVYDIAHSPETQSFVFIAQNGNSGEIFSMPMLQDKSGTEEAELLAAYIDVVADRTDRGREAVLREVIAELNEIPAGATDRSEVSANE